MGQKTGTLYLIPTPIDEQSPLEQTAFDLLNEHALKRPEQSLFIIEDLRPGRRRWLRFGLPRENVEDFILFNEQTQKERGPWVINQLQQGKDAFLMSDGGLPAFCDPGQELVDLCHNHQIKVTSTPFPHSPALAVALSGLGDFPYTFVGFLKGKGDERIAALKGYLKRPEVLVIMDTPYRMSRLLEEIAKYGSHRRVFVALDLNSDNEELWRGSAQALAKKAKGQKREFILVVGR